MPPALDILADAIDAVSASLPQFVRNVAFYGERPDARKVALSVKCMVTEDTPSQTRRQPRRRRSASLP